MDSNALDQDIRAAADGGDLITAVKLLRERSGMDLATAKRAIDDYLLVRQGYPPLTSGMLPVEAIASLQEGNIVAAIRQTRASSRLGLKEARDTVLQYLAANPSMQQQYRDAAARQRHPWRKLAVAAIVVVVVLALLREWMR
jgi:ribosomal protein L7/L12